MGTLASVMYRLLSGAASITIDSSFWDKATKQLPLGNHLCRIQQNNEIKLPYGNLLLPNLMNHVNYYR